MMLGLLPLAFGFSLQPVPVSLPPLRRDNGQHGLRMVDTPQPQPETVDRFLAKYAWNPLRRNVYALLKPVDKGEFRWEFLVPWVNRSLTTIDKVVVCSAFVVASFTLQKLFDPGASVGVHVSNIAQFFSYAMGNPVGFRSLALLSSASEIFGDVLETKNSGVLTGARLESNGVIDGEDIVPIGYNLLFLVINSYYILRWLVTRDALLNALEWDEDAENVYRDCFKPLGFRRAQFSRLVPHTRIEANEGLESRLLTVQGEPLTDLFVLLEGSLEVRVGNTVATRLPPFQLVGEASLLENLQSPGGTLQPAARATIVAMPGAKYVRWSQRTFYELQEEEEDFAEAVQVMIARTLSRKLGDARQQGSARGGVCRGAGFAEGEIAKTARWQEREVELKLEIEQSKAAVSSLRVTFIAFVCLVGLSVYATSILQL